MTNKFDERIRCIRDNLLYILYSQKYYRRPKLQGFYNDEIMEINERRVIERFAPRNILELYGEKKTIFFFLMCAFVCGAYILYGEEEFPRGFRDAQALPRSTRSKSVGLKW